MSEDNRFSVIASSSIDDGQWVGCTVEDRHTGHRLFLSGLKIDVSFAIDAMNAASPGDAAIPDHSGEP